MGLGKNILEIFSKEQLKKATLLKKRLGENNILHNPNTKLI